MLGGLATLAQLELMRANSKSRTAFAFRVGGRVLRRQFGGSTELSPPNFGPTETEIFLHTDAAFDAGRLGPAFAGAPRLLASAHDWWPRARPPAALGGSPAGGGLAVSGSEY